MKLKKGDNVIVRAGKDRGKSGKVTQVLPKENKVVVEGINLVKKNRRAQSKDKQGTTLTLPMPIHVSNVMFADDKNKKGSRLGKKLVGKKWVRIAKKNNTEV